MIAFLKKYRAFLLGFLITFFLIRILSYYKIILIDADEEVENVSGYIFWWLFILWPVYKFAYLRKHRYFIFKFLALIAFLIAGLNLDTYLNIPDNPFSILIIILFFLGVSYLIAPLFFNKYRIFILSFYALSYCYFLIARMLMYGNESYNDHKDIFMILFFIPIPMAIALWFYEQWKWLKNLKSEKTMAELAMLRSQINPHFFFNTLNNLHALTVMQSDKAPEVVLKLSDMMRYTIYEGQKDQVLLSEEIAYLKNYIALHEIRHHQKVAIDFVYHLDGEVMVAPLLFIILLENAFKHGAEKLTENAFIRINLSGNEKEICCIIENNFEESDEYEAQGIGLENLKRRLSLIYPDRHQLIITEKDNLYRAELTIDAGKL
jgi:hypothetical protein